MESYKEYPIRCKTCNEQLSCYSSTYEDLLSSGLTIEEALNELGIINWCSRSAMFNPTIVAFNMENREIIEGFKDVNAASEADSQNESMIRPVFNPCMGTGVAIQVGKPTAPLLLGLMSQRVPPNVPGVITQQIGIPQRQLAPGIQTIGMVQPAMRVQPTIPMVNSPVVEPIIMGIELNGENAPLGIGIPVEANEKMGPKKFQEPVTVGVPTINSNHLTPQMTTYVGSVGNKVVNIPISNGRTYLAR